MSEAGVSVVATGTTWMGGGIGSIGSALERLFREAEQEISLTVYAIGSGTDLLFDWLEASLVRGVQIRLVANSLCDQPSTAVTRLYQLAEAYPHLQIYDFMAEEHTSLHAKAVVVDRRLAQVGSSNLSRRGLWANHELAVLLDGSAAAEVARAIDLLCTSHYVVREGRVFPGK